MIVVGFVAAAAAGTLVRWRFTVRFGRASGTMIVNLAGAFVLGLLAGADDMATTILGLAALGSMTTFSTLALTIVELAETKPAKAVSYGLVALAGGVAAAWLGLQLS